MEVSDNKQARSLYARKAYADAFGFGSIDVGEWRTALLVRPIPRSDWRDALGCYPLALLDRNADLKAGLEQLRAAKLVSVALVPDPLTGPSEKNLAAAFEICRPFKMHYAIDREAGAIRFSTTHRRWIRKALRLCAIEPVELRDTLGDWKRLYAHAVARHEISDVQNFAPSYFDALAKMPEVSAFAARNAGNIVAMALWVRSGNIAYYHLGASAPEGYEAQAMYGIIASAIDYFSDCGVLHLGGAAGISGKEDDGLAYFKKGFANRAVEAYFCGACLDSDRYAILTKNRAATSFFPAYRER